MTRAVFLDSGPLGLLTSAPGKKGQVATCTGCLSCSQPAVCIGYADLQECAMHQTPTIPVTVEPEAAALVAELGVQAALEQMLDHARRTITGLQCLNVKFGPAYDTGEERIVIEAIRDPASPDRDAWDWDHFSRWKITTFSPDVYRHFTLLDEYSPNHAG